MVLAGMNFYRKQQREQIYLFLDSKNQAGQLSLFTTFFFARKQNKEEVPDVLDSYDTTHPREPF